MKVTYPRHYSYLPSWSSHSSENNTVTPQIYTALNGEIETIDTKSGLHARENKKSGKKDIVNKPQYNTLQFVDVREKLLDVIGKFEKKNLGVWNIYISKKDMYPEYAREAFEQGLRDNLKWLEKNRKKILGILQAPQPKAVTPKVVVPKPPTPKPPTPKPPQLVA